MNYGVLLQTAGHEKPELPLAVRLRTFTDEDGPYDFSRMIM